MHRGHQPQRVPRASRACWPPSIRVDRSTSIPPEKYAAHDRRIPGTSSSSVIPASPVAPASPRRQDRYGRTACSTISATAQHARPVAWHRLRRSSCWAWRASGLVNAFFGLRVTVIVDGTPRLMTRHSDDFAGLMQAVAKESDAWSSTTNASARRKSALLLMILLAGGGPPSLLRPPHGRNDEMVNFNNVPRHFDAEGP